MKYVLDTNAASALMRGDEAVIDRLAQASRPDVKVPQPVLAEIVLDLFDQIKSSFFQTVARVGGWIDARTPFR